MCIYIQLYLFDRRINRFLTQMLNFVYVYFVDGLDEKWSWLVDGTEEEAAIFFLSMTLE